MSATGSVTAALAAVLLLTACGGNPEVPATVGPTAGADPEPTYEPTSFPYEAAMELTAEERAELDELTLLIDEYTEYTSGNSEHQKAGFESILPNLSQEFAEETRENLRKAEEDGMDGSGSIKISESLVENFSQEEGVKIWLCFDYTNYERTKNGVQHESSKENDERLFLYHAEKADSTWRLTGSEFYDSSCEEIRA